MDFSKEALTMNQRIADGEEITVDLDLDDGRKVTCSVLIVITVESKDYIALLPLDENGKNEDGEFWFYGFRTKDGDPILDYIGDDDEYLRVSEEFSKYLDSGEYDEMIDDSEE